MTGSTSDALDAVEAQEELDELAARIASGERFPWLFVTAGEAAATAGEWPFAIECLRRIDPCSEPAHELRRRLEHDFDCPLPLPERPEGLRDDPAESVARAFHDALSPAAILASARRLGPPGWSMIAAAIVAAALPGALGTIVEAAVLSGFLALLATDGVRVRDQAWIAPQLPACGRRAATSEVSREEMLAGLGAMASTLAPFVCAFLLGAGWALLLAPATAAAALLIVGSSPLHVLGMGFPFAAPPTPREAGAFLFGGLLVSAGSILSALFAWMGGPLLLAALVLAVITWTFANRSAGLLARRLHARLAAERAAAEPLDLGRVRAALTPVAELRRPDPALLPVT